MRTLALTLLAVAACSRGAPLTEADIERAEAAWRAHAVDDYTLDIEVEGDLVEAGEFHIVVDDGRVIDARRNGRPITTRDPFYTVPGMFKFLRDELEMAGQAGRYWQAGPDTRIYQQAQFDGVAGYPRKYLRAVTGTKHNITLKIATITARAGAP